MNAGARAGPSRAGPSRVGTSRPPPLPLPRFVNELPSRYVNDLPVANANGEIPVREQEWSASLRTQVRRYAGLTFRPNIRPESLLFQLGSWTDPGVRNLDPHHFDTIANEIFSHGAKVYLYLADVPVHGGRISTKVEYIIAVTNRNLFTKRGLTATFWEYRFPGREPATPGAQLHLIRNFHVEPEELSAYDRSYLAFYVHVAENGLKFLRRTNPLALAL